MWVLNMSHFVTTIAAVFSVSYTLGCSDVLKYETDFVPCEAEETLDHRGCSRRKL
jgi:hypothetical protein